MNYEIIKKYNHAIDSHLNHLLESESYNKNIQLALKRLVFYFNLLDQIPLFQETSLSDDFKVEMFRKLMSSIKEHCFKTFLFEIFDELLWSKIITLKEWDFLYYLKCMNLEDEEDNKRLFSYVNLTYFRD